jgi:hypothetical protein
MDIETEYLYGVLEKRRLCRQRRAMATYKGEFHPYDPLVYAIIVGA